MTIPFSVVQGVIFIADKFGNVVGTKHITGELDQGGVDPLSRIAADTTIRGGSSPFAVADVDPATKALKVLLGGSLSSGSSTTTPLGANGVFTGAWTDVSDVAYITVLVNADHDSATDGFRLDWSDDGSTVRSSDLFTFDSGNPDPATRQYTFGAVSKFFRVKFTNGPIAQTSFVLQTILKVVGTKSSHQRVGNFSSVEADAELVKAAMASLTPTGDIRLLNSDNNGYLIVAPLAGFNAAFNMGYVATAVIASAVIRATTYTEQTTNAQRSVKSSSTADTAAGTGARTIRITYYTETFTGPFTTNVTLNGTTAVNTSVSNICYIEKIDVLTAGSGGVNAGIISLFVGTGGAGGTIGTIAVGDNKTFWCHHYVPTGKTMVITGFIGTHSNTVVGGGGMFLIKAKDLLVANSVDRQVSDFLRVYGQASSSPRNYGSPIKVVGPARVVAYVTPETSSASIYRAAIDYSET
jgi:hypothetical protein